jgi:hypothetical protein
VSVGVTRASPKSTVATKVATEIRQRKEDLLGKRDRATLPPIAALTSQPEQLGEVLAFGVDERKSVGFFQDVSRLGFPERPFNLSGGCRLLPAPTERVGQKTPLLIWSVDRSARHLPPHIDAATL